MEDSAKKQKRKYIATIIIEFIVLIFPLLIYAIFNAKNFTKETTIGLSITGVIIIAILGIVLMCKVKLKGGVYILITAIIILILQDITTVLGTGLLIGGISLSIDGYIINPVKQYYKGMYYDSTGRKVVYSKKLD